MTTSDASTWLYLYLLFYGAIALYWAHQAAKINNTSQDFFDAGKSLPSWMNAIGIAGASVSGYIVLGFPQTIATQGFSFAVLALAGVVIPLTGVLFFKRQWQIAKRYNYSNQGEMLEAYYGGKAISMICTLVALLFAIGFSGLQLRALGRLLSEITQDPNGLPVFIWCLAGLLAGYVIIGGMRAVGFLSAIQSVLMAVAIATLGIWVMVSAPGFANLNAQLTAIASDPVTASNGLFKITGVIQFTAGLGVEEPLGGQWTAVMIASFALSMLGIQASPMISQLVISSRNAKGFAAGQTWISAGVFGLLIVVFIVIIGAAALGTDGRVLATQLNQMLGTSPWFAATVVIGLVAAVQVVGGLSLVAAADTFIKCVYVPFYHKGLTETDKVRSARLCILLLLGLSASLASLAPIALSAIGALALPFALQLWPALVGLCWYGFITRQAVVVGAAVGFAAVFLTDAAGRASLGFLGLELPWGKWPWTIHSGAWGLFLNLIAVVIISAVTRNRGHSVLTTQIQQFSRGLSPALRGPRGLKPAAWSAVLGWSFLAIGPGTIFANQIFGAAGDGMDGWLLGMPSLWAWTISFWILGILLIWFLAYKLKMATSPVTEIHPLKQAIVADIRDTKIQRPELLRLMWTVTSIAALVTLTNWIFGT